MSSIQISCPAKTFVLGEYAVLDGGSAVLVNTSPRFVFNIGLSSKAFSFPEMSPADQWMQTHLKDFKNVSMNWSNPYGDKGGLGFSATQFIAVYVYSLALKNKRIEDVDPKQLWQAYRDLPCDGVKPSGADIISQWIGGVCVFEQNPLSFQSVTLPFSDLEFKIFRAGSSLKTHQHLKTLKLPSVKDLKEVAANGVSAVESRDEALFLKSINEYRKLLKDKKLVNDKTIEMLEELDKIQEVSALKGCGAMGADMVIIFYNKEHHDIIKEKTAHLPLVASTEELTYGVEFHEQLQNMGKEI